VKAAQTASEFDPSLFSAPSEQKQTDSSNIDKTVEVVPRISVQVVPGISAEVVPL